jgi:hypothetical protein
MQRHCGLQRLHQGQRHHHARASKSFASATACGCARCRFPLPTDPWLSLWAHARRSTAGCVAGAERPAWCTQALLTCQPALPNMQLATMYWEPLYIYIYSYMSQSHHARSNSCCYRSLLTAELTAQHRLQAPELNTEHKTRCSCAKQIDCRHNRSQGMQVACQLLCALLCDSM